MTIDPAPISLVLHRRSIVSDSWLILIPTDPMWQPEPAAAERAATRLAQLLPRAEAVSSEFKEDVEFIDAGSNFDTAACPECAADVTEWWFEAMNTASEVAFADLSCTMPCCGEASSLNDLDYDMPVGFSRFALSASNPDVSRFDGDDLRSISKELGHPIRTIWRHL